MKFNTDLLHSEFAGDPGTGATLTPIYQSTAFSQESAERLEAMFSDKAPGFSYSRIGNPTIASLERRLASLDGGIGAVACASGMAAISLAVMALVESGDEIVSAAGVFGGTLDLFRDLAHFGIKTTFLAAFTPASLAKAVSPKTKLIFTEAIGNPKLDIPDFDLLGRFAAEREIPLMVDSTAATPYLFQPKNHGAAVVIHSTSKYISGSGNTIGGVIIDTGKYRWNAARHPALGRAEKFGDLMFLSALRQGLFRNVGACASPFGAYLTALGLETLGIRMEKECAGAMTLAEYFFDNTRGTGIGVNYPGLAGSPWHEAAKQYFGGRYGALFTLRTGTKERAFRLINGLKLAKNAANIGDVRTLVIHPASTIFVHADEALKRAAGVYDDLIRISVGIEEAEDLIADFDQAIRQL